MAEFCSICGDDIQLHYAHQLNCNHTFHYECLFKSFKFSNNNNCPYCRSSNNVLPLVNGIKIVDINIHDTQQKHTYVNKKCDYILNKGKNKGNVCNKNCKLGYFKCGNHFKINKN